MVRILTYYETWRVYSKLLLLLYYYFLTLKVFSAFVVSDGLTVIHFYASADSLLLALITPSPPYIKPNEFPYHFFFKDHVIVVNHLCR